MQFLTFDARGKDYKDAMRNDMTEVIFQFISEIDSSLGTEGSIGFDATKEGNATEDQLMVMYKRSFFEFANTLRGMMLDNINRFKTAYLSNNTLPRELVLEGCYIRDSIFVASYTLHDTMYNSYKYASTLLSKYKRMQSKSSDPFVELKIRCASALLRTLKKYRNSICGDILKILTTFTLAHPEMWAYGQDMIKQDEYTIKNYQDLYGRFIVVQANNIILEINRVIRSCVWVDNNVGQVIYPTFSGLLNNVNSSTSTKEEFEHKADTKFELTKTAIKFYIDRLADLDDIMEAEYTKESFYMKKYLGSVMGNLMILKTTLEGNVIGYKAQKEKLSKVIDRSDPSYPITMAKMTTLVRIADNLARFTSYTIGKSKLSYLLDQTNIKS